MTLATSGLTQTDLEHDIMTLTTTGLPLCDIEHDIMTSTTTGLSNLTVTITLEAWPEPDYLSLTLNITS